MNCLEFDRFIAAVPLRLRSDRELGLARLHAEECPACARRLALAESLERSLESLPSIPPGDRLALAVMKRVSEAVPPARASQIRSAAAALRNERIAWAATAAGMVLLAGSYLNGLDLSRWLQRLSPFGIRVGNLSWLMDAGTELPIMAISALLLALGILLLPTGIPKPLRLRSSRP